MTVGDLARDTAVDGGGGRYTADLAEAWAIWGPNGGYLAAVALRAVGAQARLARPASFLCHFLGVAAFAPVELEVETVRHAKRAESVRVSMTQGGRRILEGLAWVVVDDLDGMVHDAAPPPAVPRPEELASVEELEAAHGVHHDAHPFFGNLEQRPLDWVADWDGRPAGEPVHRAWYRFRPTPTFGDPWVDAGRLLVMVDTFQWPAAARGHASASLDHIAPSLDLACRFHRLDEAARSEWLLVEARSPVAADGLVAGTASVWDVDGRLLASGGQQMLCRPAS
jgi:acyl-CoA thioesterase II